MTFGIFSPAKAPVRQQFVRGKYIEGLLVIRYILIYKLKYILLLDSDFIQRRRRQVQSWFSPKEEPFGAAAHFPRKYGLLSDD